MGPEVSNKAPVSVPYRTDIANNYSLSYPSRTLTANASSLNLDAGNNTSFDKRTVVQSKLEVSQPNDVYEQEADFMADAIMRNTYDKDNTFFSNGNNPSIQRFGGAPVSISSDMETQLNVSRGGGHSLPDAFRSKMENSFGADFTGVRIHTDAPAAQMSRDIQAKAFTHGNDIYFNSGQYQPDNSDGRLLLAHELTHVVQQSGMIGRDPDPDTEREIDYSRQISTTQVPQVNMSTLQETTPQALNTPTPEELANDSAKAKKMKREERAEFLFGERSQDALNKKKVYQSEEEARENMERLKVDVWQNSSDLSVGEESTRTYSYHKKLAPMVKHIFKEIYDSGDDNFLFVKNKTSYMNGEKKVVLKDASGGFVWRYFRYDIEENKKLIEYYDSEIKCYESILEDNNRILIDKERIININTSLLVMCKELIKGIEENKIQINNEIKFLNKQSKTKETILLIENKKGDKSSLDSFIKILKTIQSDARNAVNTAKKDKKQSNTAIKKAQDNIKKAQGNKTKVQGRIETIEDNDTNLSNEIKALDAEIKSLTMYKTSIEKNLERLKRDKLIMGIDISALDFNSFFTQRFVTYKTYKKNKNKTKSEGIEYVYITNEDIERKLKNTAAKTTTQGIGQQITKLNNEIKKTKNSIKEKEQKIKDKTGKMNSTISQNFSEHSHGTAIDINTMLNLHLTDDKTIAIYNSYVDDEQERFNKFLIKEDSIVVKTFKQYGWSWGGDWDDSKDYMHFEWFSKTWPKPEPKPKK